MKRVDLGKGLVVSVPDESPDAPDLMLPAFAGDGLVVPRDSLREQAARDRLAQLRAFAAERTTALATPPPPRSARRRAARARTLTNRAGKRAQKKSR